MNKKEISIIGKLKREREKDEEKGIFVCPYCNGTGKETNSYKGHTEIEDCIFCEGRGRLIIPEVIIEKIKKKEREKLLEKLCGVRKEISIIGKLKREREKEL